MRRKFTPGDLVACVEGYGKAEPGATATVVENDAIDPEFVKVAWNPADGRVCGQTDGGYREHRFEKIEPGSFPGAEPDLRVIELVNDYLGT